MLGENFDQLRHFVGGWVIFFHRLLILILNLKIFYLFRQLSKFLPRVLINFWWLIFFMGQRFFQVNLDVVFLLDASELLDLGSLAARIVVRLTQTLWDAIFSTPRVCIFSRHGHRAQSISLSRPLSLLCLEIGVGPPLIVILRRNTSSHRLLRTSELILLLHGPTVFFTPICFLSWWHPRRILLLRLVGIGSLLLIGLLLLLMLLLLETLPISISLAPSVWIPFLLQLGLLLAASTPKCIIIDVLLRVPSVRAASVSWINSWIHYLYLIR